MKNERIDDTRFQNALANILMNPEVRRLFLDDHQSVKERFDLSQEQVELLASADIDRMVEFSNDLWDKRIVMLSKRCPNTLKLLQESDLIGQVAVVYLNRHLPKQTDDGMSRPTRDFWWFAEVVDEMLKQGEIKCRYLDEVLRCEKAATRLMTDDQVLKSAEAFGQSQETWPEPKPEEVLEAWPRLGWHAQVEAFDCDAVELMRRLSEGESLEEVEQQPTWLLFTKLPGWRQQKIVRINYLTARLLELCDGKRRTREIVDVLVRENPVPLDAESARVNCANVLIQMYKVLTVTLDRFPAV